MRKHFLFSLALIFLAILPAFSQIPDYNKLVKKGQDIKPKDTNVWSYSGDFSLGFNQGLLHNWQAGGELASLTVSSLFDGTLTYLKNRKVWATSLNAAYGLLYAYSNEFVPRKTDDRIDLTSRYGYQLTDSSHFYITALLNARTQFTKGYDYGIDDWQDNPVSNFLSPLYVTLAPGIEYREDGVFTLFFSPAALRATYVDKYYTLQFDEGAFGVPHGKSSRYEFGAYLSARFKKEFSKHFSFRTRLDLYSNYLAHDESLNGQLVKKDNPGNIDILWDNHLSFVFLKYLSFNIGLTAIYDNDIPYRKYYTDDNGDKHLKKEPVNGLGWWQLKEIMNIGFNYKF